MKPVVITVDGPSGVGKGTLSARLAEYYGYHLLDSGALYRLVGLACLQQGWAVSDSVVVSFARDLPVVFKKQQILLNNKDVTIEIRNESVASMASQVAAIAEVRSALLDFQHHFVTPPGLIADGRDMGTIVFPNADAKIFLDATAEIRAFRRANQLKIQGIDVNIVQITQEIFERDQRDRQRSVAPLIAAKDALTIDSSELCLDEVFETAIEWIGKKLTIRQ